MRDVQGDMVDPADFDFDALVNANHTVEVSADVLLGGEVVVEGLNVVSGNIRYDRNASRHATAQVVFAEPTRVPVASDNVLSPFGYEIRLWRGVSVSGGKLMCALGTFPIQRSDVDGVTLASTVTATDRSQWVSDDLFEDAYQIASGTLYWEAIQDLIGGSLPAHTVKVPETADTTPTLTFTADEDRWSMAQQMAKSIGYQLLFDGMGDPIGRPETSFDDTPQFTFSETRNIISARMGLNRGPAYNKVIATSANAGVGTVYKGTAEGDSYGGTFGKKARRYSSPFLASDAQAASAALAILQSSQGVEKSLSVTAVCDPRLEASDLIYVKREALGVDELFIVDAVTIGLQAANPMQIDVRAQRVPV